MTSSDKTKKVTEEIEIKEEENKEEEIKEEEIKEEEIKEEEIEEIEEDDFIFIYEYEKKFYSKLEDIKPSNGQSVFVHPVFYEGYDNNMNSEEIIYSEDKKKFKSNEEDGSWLDIIYSHPNSIDIMDMEKAVVYDDKFFHCDGDLLYYLVEGEPETVDIL